MSVNIGCPTTYQTRHFFNNSKTNEDIATKQTHTTDTFLFISHTTNTLLFKSSCNIFIGFRFIKEMPGLVGSGAPCICQSQYYYILEDLNLQHHCYENLKSCDDICAVMKCLYRTIALFLILLSVTSSLRTC
jgi:hypothetical protein